MPRASLPYAISTETATLLRSRTSVQRSSKELHKRLIGQAELNVEYAGLGFLTNITVGNQNFSVIVDTGSSDTWLAETGFQCLNYTTNAPESEADCGFASTFSPDSSFTQIQDENFNISYADLEFLNGIVGTESVTIAGIKVSKQEIGLATLAGWAGDGISSGLTGLAYPLITSAYAGTDPKADQFNSTSSHLPYSPIINTIFFVENLTEPVFSLSLSRSPAIEGFGGYLTIGGIPDVTLPAINASNTFAITDILPIESTFSSTMPQFVFYVIEAEAIIFDELVTDAIDVVIDSGTTLNYLPSDVAEAFNLLFDPPGEFVDELGVYIVECNAAPPDLGITISGETFYHNTIDLIFDGQLGDNLCLSGVQDGGVLGAGSFILGDVFLKNVLAVFDIGKEQMAFSARLYYASQ